MDTGRIENDADDHGEEEGEPKAIATRDGPIITQTGHAGKE